MASEPVPTRLFRDRDGRQWRVWWSPDAHLATADQCVAIRPPGVWFESAKTGARKFLFHPGVTFEELTRMPAPWLQQWLDKADTPE